VPDGKGASFYLAPVLLVVTTMVRENFDRIFSRVAMVLLPVEKFPFSFLDC
jgi:hypothetical protein